VARSGISARRQELALALPDEPIFLNADATRLDQVFGNLLGNACKYSDAGATISLRVERAPATGTEPPDVIVRVGDTGMGIAPELLPHIFDLFVQATRALDRAHGGLGIGLTLVQRLVKLHGGSVEARSEGLGRGSEFIVRLPTLAARPAELPPPAAPAAPPEASRRILIVDDNEDSTRTMAILQRRRGHETRTSFTGPDAVAVAAEFVPEVVLLDIGLPGMDGYEVARRLRAMPALAGAFLVAMSGYGSEEDRAEARAAGFDEYLVKPVDLDLLRTWLRSRG
jgi:CheY-like chemotaxis protein